MLFFNAGLAAGCTEHHPGRSQTRLQSPGVAVIKPNYRQQKKQKELARKTRQAQKQKRRAERSEPETTMSPTAPVAGESGLPEKPAS